jgi:hypothetical protein
LLIPVLGVASYLVYTQSYEPPHDSDIFAVVEGRWAWTTSDSGCASDWHRISFTPARTVMTIAASKPYEGADGKLDSIAVYDILSHTGGSIRGAIRGETRLTDDGAPVVWDLVLQGPNNYAWHRTDWLRGAVTREIQRCP